MNPVSGASFASSSWPRQHRSREAGQDAPLPNRLQVLTRELDLATRRRLVDVHRDGPSMALHRPVTGLRNSRACRPWQTPIGLDSGPSSPPRPVESEEYLCWCLAAEARHHVAGALLLSTTRACARRRDLCGSCAAQPLPPAAGYWDRADFEIPLYFRHKILSALACHEGWRNLNSELRATRFQTSSNKRRKVHGYLAGAVTSLQFALDALLSARSSSSM